MTTERSPQGWPRRYASLGLASGALAGLLMSVYHVLLADRDLTGAPFVSLQDVAISTLFLGTVGAVVAALAALAAGAATHAVLRNRTRAMSQAVTAGICLLGAVTVAAAAGPTGVGVSIADWPIIVAALATCAALLSADAVPARLSIALYARLLVASVLTTGAIGITLRLIGTGRLPDGIAGAAIGAIVAAAAGAIAWWLSGAVLTAVGEKASGVAGLAVGILALAVVVAGGIGIAQQVARSRSFDRKVSALPAHEQSTTEDRPDIILISVDTLRPDFLGYNEGAAHTPNIDELAAQSTVFERTWSVAPWTRPSFASFFSGVYPSQVGQGRYRDAEGTRTESIPHSWDDSRPTLATLLSKAGYFTSAVVTNPQLTASVGASRGFDFYHHCAVDEMVSRVASNNAWTLLRPLGILEPDDQEMVRANRVSARAVQFAQTAKQRPLFLWVHHMDPHQPYNPPTIPLRERITREGRDLLAAFANMEAQSAVERARWVNAYTAEIEFLDQELGDLLRTLRSQGLLDDAIVVFWSDHGEEFWEHDGWEHGHTLYDEVVRVPLLIHMPGQTQMQKLSAPVSLLDVMPTLLREAGVDAPDDLEGRELQPAMAGEDPGEFRTWLEACSYGSIRKALLTERYKLIFDTYDEKFELYDLEADPGELNNLFGTPAAPDTTQMEADLRAWTEEALARMKQYAGQAGAAEVDPNARESLRDMGYIQ